MFLAKLKATVATLMVVAVLGGGLVYSGSGGGPAKPQNELEALRRENELLKVNLRVSPFRRLMPLNEASCAVFVICERMPLYWLTRLARMA